MDTPGMDTPGMDTPDMDTPDENDRPDTTSEDRQGLKVERDVDAAFTVTTPDQDDGTD
jgi:hypothetical protein